MQQLGNKVGQAYSGLMAAKHNQLRQTITSMVNKKSPFKLQDVSYKQAQQLLMKMKHKAKAALYDQSLKHSAQQGQIQVLTRKLADRDREVVELQEKLNQMYIKQKEKKTTSPALAGEGKLAKPCDCASKPQKNLSAANAKDKGEDLARELKSLYNDIELLKSAKDKVIDSLNARLSSSSEVSEENEKLKALLGRIVKQTKANMVEYERLLETNEELKAQLRSVQERPLNARFRNKFGALCKRADRLQAFVEDFYAATRQRLNDLDTSRIPVIRTAGRALAEKVELLNKKNAELTAMANNTIQANADFTSAVEQRYAMVKSNLRSKLQESGFLTAGNVEQKLDNFFKQILDTWAIEADKHTLQEQLKAKEQQMKSFKAKTKKKIAIVKEEALLRLEEVLNALRSKNYVSRNQLASVSTLGPLIEELLAPEKAQKSKGLAYSAYASLSHQYESLLTEYSELASKFAALEAKQAQEVQRADQQLGEVQSFNAKSLESVRKEYKGLMDRYQQMASKHMALQDTCTSLNEEKDKLAAKISKLQRELSVKDEALRAAKEKTEQLKFETLDVTVKEDKEKLGQLQTTLQSLRTANEALRSDLAASKEQANEAEQQRKNLVARITALQAENDALRSKVEDLKKKASSSDAKVSELVEKKLKAAREQNRAEISKLDREAQRKDDLIKSLKDKKQVLEITAEELEKEVKKLKKDAETAKGSHSALRKKLTSKEEELALAKVVIESVLQLIDRKLNANSPAEKSTKNNVSASMEEPTFEESCQILELSPDDISLFFKSEKPRSKPKDSIYDKAKGLIDSLEPGSIEGLVKLIDDALAKISQRN